MRTLLLIVALAPIAGCAGTKPAKQPGADRARPVPVVLEPPKVSERSRYQRQQDNAQALEGLTKVEGGIRR